MHKQNVIPLNQTVKTQVPFVSKRRVVRHDMTISDIEPCYRAMARHIDKQLKRKQPVRQSISKPDS